MALGPQFGPLYHGTDAYIPTGGIVHPYEGVNGTAAYASDSPAIAEEYARKKVIREYTQDFPDENAPFQRRLFGAVYNVSPITPKENFVPWRDGSGYRPVREGKYLWDSQGLNVEGVHKYIGWQGEDIGKIDIKESHDRRA